MEGQGVSHKDTNWEEAPLTAPLMDLATTPALWSTGLVEGLKGRLCWRGGPCWF